MSGNEAKTRKDISDKCLQIAGLNVNDHYQLVEESHLQFGTINLQLGTHICNHFLND